MIEGLEKDRGRSCYVEELFGGVGYFSIAVAAGTFGDFLVAVVEVHMGTDRTAEHFFLWRDVFFRLPLILVVDPCYKYPEEEEEDIEKKTADIFTGIIVVASRFPVLCWSRRL